MLAIIGIYDWLTCKEEKNQIKHWICLLQQLVVSIRIEGQTAESADKKSQIKNKIIIDTLLVWFLFHFYWLKMLCWIDEYWIICGDVKCYQFDFHLDFLCHSYVISHCKNDDNEFWLNFDLLNSFQWVFSFFFSCEQNTLIYQFNVIVAPTASFASNNRNAIFFGKHCARSTAPAAFQFKAK